MAQNRHRNNNRPNYARSERQNPADPYGGVIDKIENIIDDTYVGEGIKRTHAFTVDLTEEQYNQWKEQFWATRGEGSAQIWEVLRKACGVDHTEAAELIKQHSIVLHNNRLTFGYDQTGKSYVVPAACINEPVGFGADKEKERLDAVAEPDEAKTLNLTLRNASTFDDDAIEIEDSGSVAELKQKYADLKDCDDLKKVRVLYFGRELQDEYKLYHYAINDAIILIAVINNQLYDDAD